MKISAKNAFWLVGVLVAAVAVGYFVFAKLYIDDNKIASTSAVAADSSASVKTQEIPQAWISPNASILDERIIGSPDAPVTLIEYSSLTCPHCAKLHSEVMVNIKNDFVSSGKVKIIFRDFPLDRVAFFASKVSRCVAPQFYFSFLEVLFANQSAWATAENPQQVIFQMAKQIGFDENTPCLVSTELENMILSQQQQANKEYKVQATPTVFIGSIDGEKVSGAQDYSVYKKAIEALLPN